MLGAGYAHAGLVALAAPRKGCCGGCEDAHRHGRKTPCEEAAERKAVAGCVGGQAALVGSEVSASINVPVGMWLGFGVLGVATVLGGVFIATRHLKR